jgi:hypothetical protein
MTTNTYVVLDTRTLSTSTPSVTFSSIPQTYTDLVLVINARTDRNDQSNRPTDLIKVTYNGSNASNYSDTILGNNSTNSPFSYRESNQGFMAVGAVPGAQSNAGEFGTNIFHVQSYSNTTTYKTLLARGGNPTSVGSGNYYMGAATGLWRGATGSSKEAITSITLAPYVGSNFVSGSTFSIYGIRAEGTSPAPKATGGAIYSDSTYYYHVFGASGTFTPLSSLTADVLVVAGGGGGGDNTTPAAGGGGAGGLLGFNSQSLTATNYTCTVGAGGAINTNGGNSQFGGLTLCIGGGTGGQTTGGNGGSGGGGGAPFTSSEYFGGSNTAGQGNTGGTGKGSGSSVTAQASGGGGGAGATGGSYSGSDPATPGNGGAGVSTYSSWGIATGVGQNVAGTYWLAGGGGGTTRYDAIGTGGNGGGGNGSKAGGQNRGITNTGGGGGGGTQGTTGGAGGSGVVIVRYLKA